MTLSTLARLLRNRPIISACLSLALLPFGSVAGAQDGEWEVVYHEEFDRDKRALEQQGWWFEDKRADITVTAKGALSVHVNQRRADSGYANYQHPLDRTMRYRVRATLRSDAVRDHPKSTSNRGAVVFVPFSDQNGGWLRGGAFPQGLKGTQEQWSELVAGPLDVFPSEARYLRIMLGVEGQGTATFESVTLEQQPSVAKPKLQSPAPGEVVRTRHPTFRWESRLSDRDVLVQVRPKPAADAQGLDLKGGSVTHLQAREPLEAGRWYWRVSERLASVDSWHASEWQAFNVEPDPEAEELLFEPNWVTRHTAPSDLRVYTAGLDRERGVKAWVGEQEAAVESVGAGVYRLKPGEALAEGIHDITIEVTTAAGETARYENFYVNKRPGSVVEVAEDGRMTVDGEPFFPIGAFRDPEDRLDQFDGLLEAGFNLTHDYAIEHGQASLEETREYLRGAHAAGLKAFVGVRRADVRQNRTDDIRRWVAELMDEPALLSWYLFDEPEVHDMGAHRLEDINRQIKAIDPYQASSVVLSRPALTGVYADAADLMWVDPYPVPTRPLLMVEDYVLRARQETAGRVPVWAVLGVHDLRYWKDPKQAMAELGKPTRPTYEELRCMTHLALASGAQGLVYYWGPRSKYHIRNDAPEVWDGLRRVVGELNEMQAFLQAGPHSVNAQLPSPLRGWIGSVDGESCLVLVNPTTEALEVPHTQIRALRSSGTRLRLPSGDPLIFGPYEVVVLRGGGPDQ